MVELVDQQRAALQHVRKRALSKQSLARRRASKVLGTGPNDLALLDSALGEIQRRPPVDVNFHPDRLDLTGKSVADKLLASGTYRNQFETGISNGGVTAFEGGQRDNWEARLFGGVYQRPGTVAAMRSKYGGLNIGGHWDGACPRFGSCYFRLKPVVARRCTFTFGDSFSEPDDDGVLDVLDGVLAALLQAIAKDGGALGLKDMQAREFLAQLADPSRSYPLGNFSGAPGRALDECIEAHIHGSLRLEDDIEGLVADGSFRTTIVGRQLTAIADKYRFPLYWTPGLYLAVEDVPADFRGPTMIELAKHVAPDGTLDAAKIGQSAASLRLNPRLWKAWGSFDETLQFIKQLWHVLAAFGEPGERLL